MQFNKLQNPTTVKKSQSNCQYCCPGQRDILLLASIKLDPYQLLVILSQVVFQKSPV